MSLDSLYRGKTVLITGHTGFKGSWLATWLKILGARVVGFSLPPEHGKPNLFESAKVEHGMASIFGDIRNPSSIASAFKSYEPEIVFHLAAQSLVRRSYHDPVDTFSTNVLGTVNVLETIRQNPSVRFAIIITSDKCYENREWVYAYRENDPLGGYDPYSASKGCAELVTSAYRNSFFSKEGHVAIASARAGNVIGGGDWADNRLIPDIIKALSSNVPVNLRNPNAIRPWQHVLDPLMGYLLLGEQLWKHGDSFAEAWNFGPGDDSMMSVRELTEKVISIWNSGELKVMADSEFHEAQYLKLDSSKARVRLGWRPMIPIDSAIEITVSWYRSYLRDPGSSGKMIEDQIKDYLRRLN